MIRAVGDHAAYLCVEPLDDRRRVRAPPVHRKVQLPRDERRRPDLQLRARLLRVVAHDVMDDELVHQRVVHGALEELREAVFLAARPHPHRAGLVDRVAVRVALDDGDPLAFESRRRLRGHVSARASDEHEAVLQIRLRKDQRALALRVLPCRPAAIEQAGEQRRGELRGADDRRPGGELDAAEGILDQIERKPRLPRCVRERRPCRRDQSQGRWLRGRRQPQRGAQQNEDDGTRPAAAADWGVEGTHRTDLLLVSVRILLPRLVGRDIP